MQSTSKKFKTVDEYLSAFPAETKAVLEKMRKAILQTAPKAEEVISYNIPAFKWNGLLVWYAGYKNHIGFYPTSSGIRVFKDELSDYKTSKGVIQFPIDKALPFALIKKIVKYRMNENLEKLQQKTVAKKLKNK